MATNAEISIPVRFYGIRETQALLRLIAALAPLLGVWLSVWLANRILHWCVWAKVGDRLMRIGEDLDMTVSA